MAKEENINKLNQLIKSETTNKIVGARLTRDYFNKKSKELLSYVDSHTNFYSDEEVEFKHRILLTSLGVQNRLTCESCGCEINPKRRYEHIPKVCSSSCAGRLRKNSKIIYTDDEISITTHKRKATMLEKYGVETNSQRPEISEKLRQRIFDKCNYIDYTILDDKDKLISLYEKYPSTVIADMIGCYYGTVLGYLEKYGVPIDKHQKISREQQLISDFIVGLGYKPESNQRVLGNCDIDITCENIGIEYNGFPWHLDNFTKGARGKKYHITKTEESQKIGIDLIHIFPHQLYGKPEIVKSIIAGRLNCVEKLHARKCKIIEIETNEARNFLEANHINGYTNCGVKIGLYFEEELVHVMTFGKSRYRKDIDFEIIRSASKLNTRIIGAVSKCIKYFMNNHMVLGQKLMTYADLSLSSGKSYEKSDMTLITRTEPNYFYVHRNNNYLPESRLKYQKHKLKNMIGYDVEKTEWEIMKENGYDRFWDCGSNVYMIEK